MRTWLDKNNPLYIVGGAPLPFMKLRGDKYEFPCAAEVKFDGEFQYVVKNGGDVHLINKQIHGRCRTDMPVTKIDIPDDTVLLGELIWHVGRDFQVFSRHKLDEQCNLIVFDVLRWGGQDFSHEPYYKRRKHLTAQTFYTNKVMLNPMRLVYNKTDLDTFFDEVTGKDFEGLCIKHLTSKYYDGASREWAKKKFETDHDLAIIGFQSGTRRAKVLSVWLGYRKNGGLTPIAHCGNGLTDVNKNKLLALLQLDVIGKQKDDFLVTPKYVAKVKHNGTIYDENGDVSSIRMPRFIGDVPRLDKGLHEVDTLV